jgi:hypothetical protein
LRDEWNVSKLQLDLHALLIYRLQKATSLLLVDLEACSEDGIGLLFVQQRHVCNPE